MYSKKNHHANVTVRKSSVLCVTLYGMYFTDGPSPACRKTVSTCKLFWQQMAAFTFNRHTVNGFSFYHHLFMAEAESRDLCPAFVLLLQCTIVSRFGT